MGTVIAHILSLLGVVSMVCLLIAFILLLHLIQQAFERSGLVWGMIAVFYPPGTYLYCRRNWDIMRSRFMLIATLLLVSLSLWVILRVL